MDTELFYQMRKKLLWFRIPLAFVTAIFVVVAGISFKYLEIDFKNNSAKASAKIVGVTDYGYPILGYAVEGKEYNVPSRSLIPNSEIGSEVEIEYHKKNPTNFQIGENPLNKMSIWMIVIGTIATIGLGAVLHKRRISSST